VKLLAAVTLSVLTALVASAYAQKTEPGRAAVRNAIGMEFVSIPPGEFIMGCSANDTSCSADENPPHRVQITKAFEIGKYEVTQKQWVALMDANPSGGKGDTRPVETVSKLEAQDFLAKLSAAADGYRYRLPTEAEWEYAARAGTNTPYSGPLDQVAWYAANSDDETHPVGQKKPNAWGLYDVQGNVREWVSDLYSAIYYGSSPAVDPTGPTVSGRGGRRGGRQGSGRGADGRRGRGGREGREGQGLPNGLPVVRGGGWDQSETLQRVSARFSYYGPTLRVSDIGFRVVREKVAASP
jgi:formylglycine-generating enzyme required for sulfatase activity